MISERHTASFITKWLMTWICLAGIPKPKEVTCDSSMALLTGCIRVLTRSSTIDEYVQSYENELPSCYVRIGNAHVSKIHADFLAKSGKS